MKEHKHCFEKISVSRGYAATTKKSVALKKVDFFVQDLQKKSAKITSVKFKKIKARTSSKQLLYLRKKCLLSNKNYEFDIQFVAKKIWKKIFAEDKKNHHLN